MEENQRLYNEILDIWNNFCIRAELNINKTRKSDITDGVVTKYMFIEAYDKNRNYQMYQTFSHKDSWLGFIEAPHKLICHYESPITKDINMSVWEKSLTDQVSRKNKINSGNSLFDKTFSGSCNDTVFMNRIFQDQEIQNILLNDKLLLLNVVTENKIIKISLKNLNEKYYTVEELEENYKIFKYIVDRIIKSF
jgi:hypothetical protein